MEQVAQRITRKVARGLRVAVAVAGRGLLGYSARSVERAGRPDPLPYRTGTMGHGLIPEM